MISALVLAAGESSRMGRPKPLLPFGTETCLSLVLNACRGAKVDEILLMVGKDEAEIRKRVDLTGVTIYRNMHPDRGQTSSLQIGIGNMDRESDAFFIFPADYPLIRASVLQAMLHAHGNATQWKKIFIPSFGKRRGHPILIDKIIKSALRGLGDDEPVHDFIRANEPKIEHVKVNDPAILLDIDTPDDYKRCLDAYLARQKKAPSA